MIDFSKYHLKEKYRKVLEHLSDDDKIRTAIEKHNIAEIRDIVIYYDLQDNPLLNTLGLQKYGKDLESAYLYAEQVIKGRWPEAEPYIKTDPVYACHYAKHLIKGRFPEAEDIIKTNPECAYFYARYVIKGRWIEAEDIIKTNPYYAYNYAEEVIKGRWVEAEKYIKTSPHWAYNYAKDVIGDEKFWEKQQ